MNKMTFLLLFVLCIGMLKAQEGDLNFDEYQYDESVNWFNDGNISDVPFFYQQTFTGGKFILGLPI